MATEARKKRIQEIMQKRQAGIVAVLEDICDPHNAMAVVRTAEAFGIADVRLIFNEGKSFNPRRVGKKVSSYANQWVQFKRYKNTEECLNELKGDGYEIIATALSENAESIFNANLSGKKIVLLFGNEHSGLTSRAIALSDRTLIIPMRGMVQSLNLSVTASIVMYEVLRQRIGAIEDYLVSEVEGDMLCKEFDR